MFWLISPPGLTEVSNFLGYFDTDSFVCDLLKMFVVRDKIEAVGREL